MSLHLKNECLTQQSHGSYTIGYFLPFFSFFLSWWPQAPVIHWFLPLKSQGLSHIYAHPAFYMVAVNLNSGLHARVLHTYIELPA